ncbi:hypothetical protein AJ80_00821 [Polytolypa hystricis UAMH7299]|uniref:Mitochondrial thiamine pyrophosphate carrier 1 n=1 Tax=Polytolypa hystricis (strain UAMH7299) TaxID=1447883 RepID=A0A2B7Z2W2_POLH7|nr:hypothetical protein AJ80_00821 [Polytolypa hystricis UAMH7299]
MASAADVESQGVLRTVKDLSAGAAGGIAQVLLGQPFDIVKVRLQTTTQYSSALDCATKILKNEGPLAFYKGTLTPLIGIGACRMRNRIAGALLYLQEKDRAPSLPINGVRNIIADLLYLPAQVSVQFGAFHEARRTLESINIKNGLADSSLSYSQYYLAGAFAGVTNSVLSGPIEHVRIRLQTQPHGAQRLYNGPIDCIRKLSTQGGVFKGLYRGQAVTVIREAQAYGVWFLSFEYLMNLEVKRNQVKREDISSIKVAAYGGLAGEALWLSSYPFDVVKSRMQCDGFGPDQKFRSMTDCFKKTFAAEGLGGFWRGIGPTLLRAMPVSAGTFAV